MKNEPGPNEGPPGLKQLADFLFQQRDSILAQWRARIEADNEPSVLRKASREEFYDHIPEFLDRLRETQPGLLAALPKGMALSDGALV
jgi:hypothetical protein